MAKGNLSILEGNTSVEVWQTDAAATAIKAGEPVRLTSAGSPYVIPWADADITAGTDTMHVGIAASDSTHTATADGTVDVYKYSPEQTIEAKAKTAANVDTVAKIKAMTGDRKIIDLTSSTYTVDDGAADSVNNSLLIVGGDPVQKTLRFRIRPYINVVDAA